MSDREAALAKGRSLLQKKLSQKRDDESQSSTKKKTLKTVAKAAPKDNDAAIANENVKENVKENENENENEKEKASVVYDEQTLISEASLEEPKSADEMTMQIPSMKSVDDETSHPLKTDNFPVPLPSGASLLESGFPAKQTMSDFSIVSEETKSSAPNVSFSNTPLSSMKDKEEPLKLLIEEKEAEMKRTYEMMAELQEKNTSSQKQVEILTLQNQSLSKERDLLAKNLKVAKEEVEKMRSESIRLHDINLLYETRANEKTSELKALAGLHAELEETFTLTVSKCKTLEADLALAKANSQALSNLQTDYDRTKASLQAAQETHSALQKQYHTLDLTRKSLETTVDELKGKLESQERRLIDRNAYAERMEKDLLVKQSQVADLQAQNDELMERLRMPSENESMYQQQLKDIEEKYGQLQMQYEKAASQTLAADEFLEREKLNIKQIEAARDAALVKGDKLQASLESTNQQLEHLQQEYNTLQIEKQSVESQFAALQGEYKRLEAQDSSESTIQMIVSPAAVSQIKTLEDKLRDVTHEKDAMETQISSLLVRIESLTASCKIMEHDLDETRNKLDESKTAESLLEAKYAELERTDLDKEKIVLELRNEIDHLKRTMDEKILECNQNGASSNQELQRIHQKQVEEITNILQTAEHDRDLAQEKLLEMTMNLRVEKEKLTVLEQELNRIKTETIELRQTISDQNMKLSRQTAEMEKQTRLIAQVTQAAEQIKTQCQNLEAENIAAHEHQRMYEIAQQDIKSLTTKLRELEAEKITTASERDAIADQVCQLQTRMAEKESVVIQSSSLLTELQNEKSRLQEELNKRDFAYDELRRDFSSNITVLEEYKAIMNEQQSSIQQLDQTLGAVQIDKEASEKRCAELQDRCDNLERELDKVRKEFELSSLSNKQKSSLDASLLTELQVESEKVQSQIDGLVQSKALIEKENMSLLSKVSLLERELTLANEEKFKTVQSLQTLQEEKDNINLQVSTLVEGSRRMEMECNTLRAELDRKSQELSQTFSNLQLRETELKTISNLAETRVTESQDKELTLKRQLEVLEQSYQSLSTRYDQLKGTVHEVWSKLSRSLPTASLATPTKQDDDLVEFLSNIPQLLEKEKAALNQQVCKEDASSKDQSRKDKPPATGRKFMMPTEEKKKFIEENMTLLKQVDELSDEIRLIEPKLQINSRHRSLKEVYGDDSGQASDDFSYPLDSVAIQMLKRLAHHLGLVGYLDGEMDDTKAERLTMEIISIIARLQQIKNLFPAKEREIQDLKKAFMLINKQFDEMKERCIQLEMNKVQMGELSKLSLKQQETIHGLNLQLSQHERDFAVEEATKQRLSAFISDLSQRFHLAGDPTSDSFLSELLSGIDKKLQAFHDAEEALFSTQLELQHMKDQLDLAQQSQGRNHSANIEGIEADAAAVEMMISLQQTASSVDSHGLCDQTQAGRKNFRKLAFVVLATCRFMSFVRRLNRQQGHSVVAFTESYANLQELVKVQQLTIGELRSQIVALENTLAFERRVAQDYEGLKERFLRMVELNKEQGAKLQRMSELEHQLLMRGQAVEDLRKLLKDSSRPLQELKDELCAVNERYQSALLAKQEAEVRASREHQTCQILQTENNMLKSRLGRMNVTMPVSSRASFVSQGSISSFYPTDVYDRMQLRATKSFAQGTSSITNLEARLMQPPLSVNSNHEIEKDS